MAKSVSPKAREIAGKIADQMQANGHYQEGKGVGIDWAVPAEYRRCCIVLGHEYEYQDDVLDEIAQAIVDLVGIEEVIEGDFFSSQTPRSMVIEWNDAAKTEDVIDVLRAIEVG